MRPTTIVAAPIGGIFAASAANAKKFRSPAVHPMDYPTVEAAATGARP